MMILAGQHFLCQFVGHECSTPCFMCLHCRTFMMQSWNQVYKNLSLELVSRHRPLTEAHNLNHTVTYTVSEMLAADKEMDQRHSQFRYMQVVCRETWTNSRSFFVMTVGYTAAHAQ
jgi:hypothetical protein